MGLLDKFFGSGSTENNGDFLWKKIESEADLEKAVEESHVRKVAIFKHSTRCYISKTVLKNFEKEVANLGSDVSFYFLDLLAFRSISNKIEEDFGVRHQSPQLIVLTDGKVVKEASHHSISKSLVL